MSALEHYMYVLECGDGSLYTGYAVDVEARLAAHRSGRGARYTRSHAPVRLVARARFHSKARAMRAEALFKRLPRERKDALLARAAVEPFEAVLDRGLPGFGAEPAEEFVCRSLAANADGAYRDFMARLIPTVPPSRMVGVRTPALRAIARQVARRPDAAIYLGSLPHRLFEEMQVHAFVIGMECDYDAAVALYDRFLPYVDNWATCDQLPVKVLAREPERTLGKVGEWLASGSCYSVRFAIGVLMRLYLDERFEPCFLDAVAAARLPGSPARPEPESDAYYVDMMRAWYFVEAVVRQEDTALAYLLARGEGAPLDEWTRRKAIQKAVESRRVAPGLKARLRAARASM